MDYGGGGAWLYLRLRLKPQRRSHKPIKINTTGQKYWKNNDIEPKIAANPRTSTNKPAISNPKPFPLWW
jgi:hypothetical protein